MHSRKTRNTYLTSVAAVILVLTVLLGTFCNTNREGVLLKGIGHPAYSHWDLTYRGIPWTLCNATIGDYISSTYNLVKLLWCSSYRKVPITNARHSNLSFEQTGFLLINNNQSIGDFGESAYASHIINIFSKRFPKAKQIKILNTVYRGTGENGPLPLVHLDCTTELENLNRFPDFVELMKSDKTKYIWIMGVWTPYRMKQQLCRDQLAILDASTTSKEDVITLKEDYNHQLANGTIQQVKGEVGALVRRDHHAWYYYPAMSNEEMIVFTHFRTDQFKQNAHVSFTPSDCRDNNEQRKSVESRVLVQF